MKYNYYFTIKQEDDWFSAYIPAFNATVVDDNINDLYSWVEWAIETAVEVYKKEWKSLPIEDWDINVNWKVLLRIPKSLHKKLYYCAKNDWVSMNQYIASKLANLA